MLKVTIWTTDTPDVDLGNLDTQDGLQVAVMHTRSIRILAEDSNGTVIGELVLNNYENGEED